MKPIYEPRGKAKEYCDLAINIYTGCNHGCVYCYAPRVLHKTREQFEVVQPRKGIVEATRKQLATGEIKGREIQLCFTCDPYPADIDSTATREIIKAIKESGNHVRILTKNAGKDPRRDFDLLGENDFFGVTATCHNKNCDTYEPNASKTMDRISMLADAKYNCGCKTWVSFEPVFDVDLVYFAIKNCGECIDAYKIGMLNYHKSDIDWRAFGRECERLCIEHGRNYYIKEDLRKLM